MTETLRLAGSAVLSTRAVHKSKPALCSVSMYQLHILAQILALCVTVLAERRRDMTPALLQLFIETRRQVRCLARQANFAWPYREGPDGHG